MPVQPTTRDCSVPWLKLAKVHVIWVGQIRCSFAGKQRIFISLILAFFRLPAEFGHLHFVWLAFSRAYVNFLARGDLSLFCNCGGNYIC